MSSSTHHASIALSDFQFEYGSAVPKLVFTAPSPDAPLSLSLAGNSQSRRATCAQPLCSITMGSGIGDNPCGSTRKTPLFVIASAAESQPVDVNAPFWRVVLGNLAAGATAGCAVEAALYPVDTIKTRLQAMVGGGGLTALFASGGGKSLYAGVLGNLVGVAPSSAIFMAFYEPVKQAVQKQPIAEERQYLGPVAAGAVAGLAASLTRVPTEVIKQRLQTGEFKGAINATRSILTNEGVRGLYAGYGAFLMRDLPFDAIEFVAYEQLKKGLMAFLGGRELQASETSVIGAVAGGFTGIVTTPLDVLKTRLMTQGNSGRYKNIVDCTLQIARQEGMGAFMSGWQPRLLWISLGGFVFFPVLEASKKLFAPKVALPVEPLKMDPLPPADKKKK